MATTEDDDVLPWSDWAAPRDFISSVLSSVTSISASIVSCLPCRRPALGCLKEQEQEPDGAWFDVEPVSATYFDFINYNFFRSYKK